MNIVEKIPNMSIEEINRLRKNARAKLDDPKSYAGASEILDAIDKELERRYIPGMIATFEEKYPGGFYGDKQAEEERSYKLNASKQFHEILGREIFQELLESNEYEELYIRVAKVVNSTNFIQGSFEKPKLFDAIKSNESIYLAALYEHVWGSGNLDGRFNDFIGVLEELNICKWTYATYFLFLSSPQENIFVKPEMLKKSIEISKYPICYEPKPSYELYCQILEFSHWLKNKIAVLKPRDMIDVHSFMWHMAPTGKWSEG
ncbi:hypothetical protein [Halomonas ventosae]|uniref:Uncharacterized protein n=1 Tax=Halomonas ventosae TaxID=229007 RepID=A0A2T0VKD0_9GAMM|nr:hypothetical protein [Halomonas ventosae]PRY70643.1 hypothetical protein BCL64_1129 [Halomonas ventosae]